MFSLHFLYTINVPLFENLEPESKEVIIKIKLWSKTYGLTNELLKNNENEE